MNKNLVFPSIGVLCLCCCSSEEIPEPELVVRVRTAQAERRDIGVTVTAPAAILARQQANVAARITAPIEKLEAGLGDRVREGQVLIRLVRSDLEAQRAEAAARVAGAEAKLEKVSSGTLPGDIERAHGQLETSAAALDEADKIYHRRAELFEEGAIPEREVLLSRTQYEHAKTAHRVAQRSLELLLQNSREQDERIARSELDQAKAQLAYLDAQLGFTEIHIPFSGTITRQFLYPGDMAKPDAPVFTVMDLVVVNASGQFPEENARDIRVDQQCSFEAVDETGVSVAGRISVINKAVDPARRTVEVWCQIDNSNAGFKAGAFGAVTALTGTHENAVLVPTAAVQYEEGTNRGVVWTVGPDDLARARKVTTGVVKEGLVEVIDGLDGVENVIVTGAFGLSDGTHVEPVSGGENSL